MERLEPFYTRQWSRWRKALFLNPIGDLAASIALRLAHREAEKPH